LSKFVDYKFRNKAIKLEAHNLQKKAKYFKNQVAKLNTKPIDNNLTFVVLGTLKLQEELERLVAWRSTRSYRLEERKEQSSARRNEERPP